MTNQSVPVVNLELLSDEPIADLSEDGLNLKYWAQIVAGTALKTKGPFTVGIFGGWGMGKTSILKLAKKIIDDTKQTSEGVTTVSFNAWQYEQENMPLVPLIASIVHELDKIEDLAGRAREVAKSLRDGLRSVLFGLSTQVKTKVPFFGEVNLGFNHAKAIERYENLHARWIDKQINQSLYYNAFQTIGEIQNEGPSHRIVVFIDDLDRCFPDKAIKLLESIKLVLNQPGFIFVLAVDRRVLEDYLEKRFKEDFGLKQYSQGQSYLDKIIQLPLWIPPHKTFFRELIDKLLDQPALIERRNDFEPLTEAISLACDHNPRQLKRFLNDLLIDQRIYLSFNPNVSFPLKVFVVARGLRHQSEAVYQWLHKNMKLCDELRNCDNDESMKDVLNRRLESIEVEDINSRLLKELKERDSLLRLLGTDPGREWLENNDLRDSVDTFLSEERQFNQWIQEQVERAWAQLSSDNEEEVITACQTLSELTLSQTMYSKVHAKLEKLSQNHTDQRVRREAIYALQAIDKTPHGG